MTDDALCLALSLQEKQAGKSKNQTKRYGFDQLHAGKFFAQVLISEALSVETETAG